MREAAVERQPRSLADVGELPVSEVFEQSRPPADVAKEDVAQAVRIHIAQRNPAAVQVIVVPSRVCFANEICEADAGGFVGEQSEAGGAGPKGLNRSVAAPGLWRPLQGGRCQQRRRRKAEQSELYDRQAVHGNILRQD